MEVLILKWAHAASSVDFAPGMAFAKHSFVQKTCPWKGVGIGNPARAISYCQNEVRLNIVAEQPTVTFAFNSKKNLGHTWAIIRRSNL